MLYLHHRKRFFGHLYAGFIMSVALPLLLLIDFVLEIYHRTCFPIYGIPYIKRSEYIIIDRHRLSYLGWIQKLWCVYCGYANGWLAYATKVVGETEGYWCGIHHEDGKTYPHQESFLPYGDKSAFEELKKQK